MQSLGSQEGDHSRQEPHRLPPARPTNTVDTRDDDHLQGSVQVLQATESLPGEKPQGSNSNVLDEESDVGTTPQQSHSQHEGESFDCQVEGLQGAQHEPASHDTLDNDDDDSAVQSLAADEDDANNDRDPDAFSDYGSDTSSLFTSIFSEATDYYWENGRRYHAHQGGRYMLPNDETELDREDMKHHEWMLITDFRLHLSPIDPNPQRILDLGTGTGIWAMQIADTYPSAQVIGTDLSPVQPKWVPPNLTFEIDDLEAEWLFRPGTYDLIHVRFMFLAIRDYPAMLAQAYRTIKPGGYIELSELGVCPEATNLSYPQPVQIPYWLGLYDQAMKKMGFDFKIAHSLKAMVIEAGFVDVVETRLEVPWGAWPKNRRLKGIGLWHLEQLKQGLQGIVMGLFTRALGWTPTEVEVFLVKLRQELDDKNYRLLDHAYVIYGRKPN